MKKLVSSGLLIGLLAGAMPVGTSFAMLPSKPDLPISHKDRSCGGNVRKYKRLSESGREILERNEEIVKKYKDLIKDYKTVVSLMNDDELGELFQLILYYFNSFRERENWDKEINEKSLVKIEVAYEGFIENFYKDPERNLILDKGKLKDAIKQFFEAHSDWKIKRPVDDYRSILINSNEFEPDFDGDIFERDSGQNWGYNWPESEFNINYIPSDSSDLK